MRDQIRKGLQIQEARGDLYHGTHSSNMISIMDKGIQPTGAGEHSSGHVYAARDYHIAHAEASKAAKAYGKGSQPVVFKIDRSHPDMKNVKWNTDPEYWNKEHGDTLKDKSAFRTTSHIPAAAVKVHNPPSGKKRFNPVWLD